jgi:hypothetical protein
MSVHVNSVDITARTNVRTKVANGTLVYVAKVKLLAAFPASVAWIEVHLGYLALSSVGADGAFFTLVDCDDYSVLMVHELYFNFAKSYTKVTPTIYAFPSDLCVLGFQFLLESEAKEMSRQIEKSSPTKSRGLRSFFGKKGKAKGAAVVSMPSMDSGESRMEWDPEHGYVFGGSFADLPEEHKQFLRDHGYSVDPK